MSRKCIGFRLIKEYPRSKKLGSFEPYTTGEFLRYPEIWKPVFTENYQYTETKNNVKSFILGDEPEIIHVIETGFVDKYMVVYEDAYEVELGKVLIGTKKEIEDRFKIKL